ncbi:Flp pilus assembly protein CpaB [Stieleria sp. TO1_6]|uniref:Flp pilus assembly protein CpaB n=1 Tax=Stieleria tagensis TaxID=2956795 RepID=UPI00209B0FC1|nr:Flp pilus assembly protein CpaB [Stieleria tagensis]MCO8121774.1 Flp pilus assembly protein CpaB [Stieleria tagensis]
MRNKSLFLLVAGVCGTVAAVGVGQWMQAQPNSQPTKMVEILVTTQAINLEEEITPDKLRLEQWPADRVPTGSSSELAKFEGRYAKVPLFAGEPMLDLKLMNDVEDKVVPRGYAVVSLPAGRDGTVNLVRPGDRVDIRGFFTKGDMFPRDMALDVLTGVKVYGIDGITKFNADEPRNRSARDIQLLIRKADVEAFDFAKQLGEISLSLGSPSADDASIPEGDTSVAAKKFLEDLKDFREEQRRLRLAQSEEPAQTDPEAKKATFRMTKMVNGRLIEYEWVQGATLPRVVGDTGPLELATPDSDQTSDTLTSQTAPTSDDYLRGADSPFFVPTDDSTTEE